MNKSNLCLLFLLLFLPGLSYSQYSFRAMWYNVENLFDTLDDPYTQDQEFTPSGNRYWTPGRYYHKLQQISKVINAAGEWETPAVVGLCEIENEAVLKDLLHRTPLRQQQYKYCIAHSNDNRGIRIAFLYQQHTFGKTGMNSIPVVPPAGKRQTRDILHVWGKVITGDTLDIFLAHFPSRYGGETESENARLYAAQLLKTLTDSVIHIRQSPYILIMGDLNDTPTNRSIRKILAPPDGDLHNMPLHSTDKSITGTHKYQGEWSQLDHIVVSSSLLHPSSSLRLQPQSVRIFSPPFLLTPDKTWRGVRPRRTYYGFTYEGGYSDHLPLIADFLLSLPEENTDPDKK
ncbi:MAG: endonuclease [Tannerellaceae bacterium]|nr:endonuclease [Tannerellaceae bacterium]